MSHKTDCSLIMISYCFICGISKTKQMAELHGELMEFQENLQRQLASKETYITRLKRELVSLRGPLPEEIAPSESHSDRMGEENKRALINIWIPSVFEGGKGTDAHHVYQVLYLYMKNVRLTSHFLKYLKNSSSTLFKHGVFMFLNMTYNKMLTLSGGGLVAFHGFFSFTL